MLAFFQLKYISVCYKKQKKTYFLGIKPGQLVELYGIQNRQLIFSFMSNPTNFGINGSNCVVAFLGEYELFPVEDFYEKILGVSRPS